jgi:hypothetical protein
MTPTAVGLVLVEGLDADGEIMDQDAFDVPTRRGAAAISTSEYVASALSRTRAISVGHRPHTIGVTWTDESELEASLLLKSLTDAGFDNVVAVRSPLAGEALAQGIGRAAGYQQTAVCLLEPETVFLSLVDTYDGTLQTATQQDDFTAESLIDWLTKVFDLNDWQPESLVVVGPEAGIDRLTRLIEHTLQIPVFAPAEAELALARGAALASALDPEPALDADGVSSHRRSLPYTAALTMLAVGIVAFVISVFLLAGHKLTPNDSPTPSPHDEAVSPQVAEVVPPAAPAPVVEAAPPPAPAAPPSVVPTVEEQASAPAEEPAAVVPEEPPVVVDPVPEAAPAPTDQAAPPAITPPTPSSKPPLLTRILGHLPGLHPDPPPAIPNTPPESSAPSP